MTAKQGRSGGGALLFQGMIAIGVLVVSAGVAITVYIPYIQDISTARAKQKQLTQDVLALETKYNKINATDRNTLDLGLIAARRYIPDDIKVAELATFVNINAQKFNLAVSQLGISENKVDIKKSLTEKEVTKLLGTKKDQKVLLGRMEGPFSFTGRKGEIFSFLDFLVKSGYAINFDQVTVSNVADDQSADKWSVKFVAVYYYLAPLSNVDAAAALLEPNYGLLNITPTPTTAP